jgi:alkylglycerol monooxygenase
MINPIILAVPFFGLFIAIEFYYDYLQKTKEYAERTDTWTNIAVGFISLFFGAFFATLFGSVYDFCYEMSPFRLPANSWHIWVLALFLDDFLYYWFHRMSHESRFWWNFHVVHHSSEHYNLSVAVRQSWFGNSVAWLFYLPLALLGFPLIVRVSVHGLNLIYQFFIHTKFVPKLGYFEYIFNTPSQHRVHHAVNPQYIDKNYGGIFSIWDRMFGTFVEETETPRYGVIKQLKSFNWLWINTHGWFEMWKAMKRKKTLLGKLRCVFASPNMDFE